MFENKPRLSRRAKRILPGDGQHSLLDQHSVYSIKSNGCQKAHGSARLPITHLLLYYGQTQCANKIQARERNVNT